MHKGRFEEGVVDGVRLRSVVVRDQSSLTPSILLAGSSFNLMAASTTQMKACKMALLNEPKFQDLPMAATSVFQGKKENHARFTVRWEGLEANGNCKVSKDWADCPHKQQNYSTRVEMMVAIVDLQGGGSC